MNEPANLRFITGADELPQLQLLWQELYEHQLEHGMLLNLPKEAFDHWSKSMAPFLGRFANVFIAEARGEMVGFVAGRIRTLPPYFGSAAIGTISEVYVAESQRRTGIGRRLIEMALRWYSQQGIERVELQVVAGNDEALTFYKRLGWQAELVQMVCNAKQMN